MKTPHCRETSMKLNTAKGRQTFQKRKHWGNPAADLSLPTLCPQHPAPHERLQVRQGNPWHSAASINPLETWMWETTPKVVQVLKVNFVGAQNEESLEENLLITPATDRGTWRILKDFGKQEYKAQNLDSRCFHDMQNVPEPSAHASITTHKRHAWQARQICDPPHGSILWCKPCMCYPMWFIPKSTIDIFMWTPSPW